MSKVLIVNFCNECSHFNNQYYSYLERCNKLKRKIERQEGAGFSDCYPIPDDCPLENAL